MSAGAVNAFFVGPGLVAVQDDVVAVGEGAFELDVLARIRICSARPAVSVPLPSLRRAAAAVVLQSMKPLEDFGVSEPAERGDSNGESTYASAPNLTHHRTRVNPYAQQSQANRSKNLDADHGPRLGRILLRRKSSSPLPLRRCRSLDDP